MRLEYGSAAHAAISGLQEGGRSGMKDREVRISWWARGSPDTSNFPVSATEGGSVVCQRSIT